MYDQNIQIHFLEWFEEDEVQIDIEKAAFVTLKLAIEFGLLKLTENMFAFMVDQKFKVGDMIRHAEVNFGIHFGMSFGV